MYLKILLLWCLTILAPCILESCSEIKINLIFFTLLCGTSKGFMKAFKAFSSPGIAAGRVKIIIVVMWKDLIIFFLLLGIYPF